MLIYETGSAAITLKLGVCQFLLVSGLIIVTPLLSSHPCDFTFIIFKLDRKLSDNIQCLSLLGLGYAGHHHLPPPSLLALSVLHRLVVGQVGPGGREDGLEVHHLPPQDDLHPQHEAAQEGEEDGGQDAYEEGEEGPGGEDDEEDGDDDHVGDHPGNEKEGFVEHSAQEEEEGEEEVENHPGYESHEGGSVVGLEERQVGDHDVRHLKYKKC